MKRLQVPEKRHINPDDLAAWLRHWSAVWHIPDLDRRLDIQVSGRLRTSLGRCQVRSGRISIHKVLVQGHDDLLKEVVCHEAAHYAACHLYGPRILPHGRQWKQLVRAAGCTPRVRVDLKLLSRDARQAMAPKFLYRHACRRCGAQRTARRPVRQWRCRGCSWMGMGGRLVITRMEQKRAEGASRAVEVTGAPVFSPGPSSI